MNNSKELQDLDKISSEEKEDLIKGRVILDLLITLTLLSIIAIVYISEYSNSSRKVVRNSRESFNYSIKVDNGSILSSRKLGILSSEEDDLLLASAKYVDSLINNTKDEIKSEFRNTDDLVVYSGNYETMCESWKDNKCLFKCHIQKGNVYRITYLDKKLGLTKVERFINTNCEDNACNCDNLYNNGKFTAKIKNYDTTNDYEFIIIDNPNYELTNFEVRQGEVDKLATESTLNNYMKKGEVEGIYLLKEELDTVNFSPQSNLLKDLDTKYISKDDHPKFVTHDYLQLALLNFTNYSYVDSIATDVKYNYQNISKLNKVADNLNVTINEEVDKRIVNTFVDKIENFKYKKIQINDKEYFYITNFNEIANEGLSVYGYKHVNVSIEAYFEGNKIEYDSLECWASEINEYSCSYKFGERIKYINFVLNGFSGSDEINFSNYIIKCIYYNSVEYSSLDDLAKFTIKKFYIEEPKYFNDSKTLSAAVANYRFSKVEDNLELLSDKLTNSLEYFDVRKNLTIDNYTYLLTNDNLTKVLDNFYDKESIDKQVDEIKSTILTSYIQTNRIKYKNDNAAEDEGWSIPTTEKVQSMVSSSSLTEEVVNTLIEKRLTTEENEEIYSLSNHSHGDKYILKESIVSKDEEVVKIPSMETVNTLVNSKTITTTRFTYNITNKVIRIVATVDKRDVVWEGLFPDIVNDSSYGKKYSIKVNREVADDDKELAITFNNEEFTITSNGNSFNFYYILIY